LVIFIGTHLPSRSIPRAMPIDSHGAWFHAAAFFGLGALWMLVVLASGKQRSMLRSALIALTICLVYGSFDELTQRLAAGRTTSAEDLIADGIGAAFGISAASLFALLAFSNRRRPADS
jgi:VanZ family protein